MDSHLTEMQQSYLADKMNKVSRSFALVAPAVEAPLNDFLATAYLICRVVDNIEDCTQPFSWKQERFVEFINLLQNPAEARTILSLWERDEWPGLSLYEHEMMGEAEGLMLWHIYAHIPEKSRASIAHWALVMARGMEEVNNPDQSAGIFISRKGVRLIGRQKGYDQYCFYVAGTVGHMITELAIIHYAISGDAAKQLLENSEASGRALQKTNIIKDFVKDLERGACYLPEEWLSEVSFAPLNLEGAPLHWKRKVLDNVLQEFDDSVNYILDLPNTAMGFRRASLLMLLPGYQTLLVAAKNQHRLFTPLHNMKISHRTMGKCLLDAKLMAPSNDAILAYSRAVRTELSKALDSDRMKVTVN